MQKKQRRDYYIGWIRNKPMHEKTILVAVLPILLILSYISNVNAVTSNNKTTATTTPPLIPRNISKVLGPDCQLFPSDSNCVNSTIHTPVSNNTSTTTTTTTATTTTITNTSALPQTAHTCPDGSVADANASCPP